MRPNIEHPVLSLSPRAGDRLVFCSDGVIEAENTIGEQFGFERTREAIHKACEEGLSAEAAIDRILEAVDAFTGDALQGDDMTCVILRVEA